MNSELYKSYYLDEWSRRSEIESTLSIPVGALTVLGGGIFFMVAHYEVKPDAGPENK